MASCSVRLAQVLAHQGGWDEVLLVAGPIVVIVALLALAKHRVDDAAAEAGAGYDEAGQVEDNG
jgi:hypothetical protein